MTNYKTNPDEWKAYTRMRDREYRKFLAYLEEACSHPVDLFEGEFNSVFDRLMEFRMSSPRFSVDGGQLPQQDWRFEVQYVTDFLIDNYNRAQSNMETFMREHGDSLSWTVIRKLLASRGDFATWAIMLRMCHVSGDYGEGENAEREKTADMLFQLQDVMIGSESDDSKLAKLLGSWREDPLSQIGVDQIGVVHTDAIDISKGKGKGEGESDG